MHVWLMFQKAVTTDRLDALLDASDASASVGRGSCKRLRLPEIPDSREGRRIPFPCRWLEPACVKGVA